MRAGKSYGRPSNEVMHIWLRNDARSCRGSTALDLGAGKMKNRPLFPSMRYIAVDLNEVALATGHAEFPDAEAHVASISDFVAGECVDVAVSTLVLENKHFPAEDTIATVKHIVNQIASDGAFLFNVGPKNLVFEKELDAVLTAAFERCEKRYYGRLHRIVPFPGLVAAVMARLGPWNVPRDVSKRRAYYACWGRRPVEIGSIQATDARNNAYSAGNRA